MNTIFSQGNRLVFQQPPDALIGWLIQNYPLVAIIAGIGWIIWSIKGFVGKHELRMAQIDGKFEQIDLKFDAVESRFQHLEEKVDDIKQTVDKGFESLDRKFELIIKILLENK